MKQDHYSWFTVVRYLVLCLGISLVAVESHPSRQEEKTPDEEWTVLSQVAEADENPVNVTLRDLWARPDYYNGRLVLVRGTLRVVSSKSSGETIELQEGPVAVPLLVKDGAVDAAMAPFDEVFVEVLGRFVSMAPVGERREILNDIDSIFVGSLRRFEESRAEASAVEKESPAAGEDTSGKPPRVISSNPRPGERGVPLAGKIVLRFSEEMDEASFDGNVRLQYADDSESEDSFPNLHLSYNPDTASLVIDPGQKLERKSEVRLFLHKGILSKEGVPMLRNTLSSRRKAGIRSRRSTPAALQGEDVVVALIFYTL